MIDVNRHLNSISALFSYFFIKIPTAHEYIQQVILKQLYTYGSTLKQIRYLRLYQ